MATGYIGKSDVFGTTAAGTPQYGQTLSYTCPASGVRYAVVSVFASVTCSSGDDNGGYAKSGIVCCGSSGHSNGSDGEEISDSASECYSVILSPGQTWSATTEVFTQDVASNPFLTQPYLGPAAMLQASVLEVI